MEATAQLSQIATGLESLRAVGKENRSERLQALKDRAAAAWNRTKAVTGAITEVVSGLQTARGREIVGGTVAQVTEPARINIEEARLTAVDTAQEAVAAVKAAPGEAWRTTRDAVAFRIDRARKELPENLANITIDIGNRKDVAVFDAKSNLLSLQKKAREVIMPVVNKGKEWGATAFGYFNRQKDLLTTGIQTNMSEVAAAWGGVKQRTTEVGAYAAVSLGEKLVGMEVKSRHSAETHRNKAVELRQKAAAIRTRPLVARA